MKTNQITSIACWAASLGAAAWITHTHMHSDTSLLSHAHTHTACPTCPDANIFIHLRQTHDCWPCEICGVWCVCVCVCVCVWVSLTSNRPTNHYHTLCEALQKCNCSRVKWGNLKALRWQNIYLVQDETNLPCIQTDFAVCDQICLSMHHWWNIMKQLWPYLPLLSALCSHCCSFWVILVHRNNLVWPWIAPLYAPK